MKIHKFFFFVAFMIAFLLFVFAVVKPQFFAAEHTMPGSVECVAMAEQHQHGMVSLVTPMHDSAVAGGMNQRAMHAHSMTHMHTDLI